MKIFALLVLLIRALPLAADEYLAYDVYWRDQDVGAALMTRHDIGEVRCVDYRINVVVRKLGITVYRMSRHHRALLDRNGLVAAHARNRDGSRITEVEARRSGNDLIITRDGRPESIPFDQLVETTLSPLIQTQLRSGTWLDLNKGSLVEYAIDEIDDRVRIVRPEGEDILSRDERGLPRTILIADKDGKVELRRSEKEVELHQVVQPEQQMKELAPCEFASKDESARARLKR